MTTSVASNQSVEDKVTAGLTQILRGEALEEGFANLISHTEEHEKIKRDYNIDLCKQIWIALSPEFHDAAMKVYAHSVYKQQNGRRTKLLLDLLENMVENNILSPKLICIALLNDESLDYRQEEKWCQIFKFVRTVIGGVDYKGCRDLLRVLLEKCQSIPVIENVSVLPQVEAIHNVIAYVLDRNACLLPSLFAVHEITKFCGDGLVWPHWKLGRLMSDFIYSFQPTAQMVTTTGRTSLLPVVGHSLATSNVWRLNPTDLKFTLSGLLPYKKELLEPQTRLLRYVLDQPYSRDMVCSMLGLNKQVKQRCVVLEDQLVDLVVQAMENSEHDEASGDETGVSQLFWQHLSSQLIFFVLFQFASFPHTVLSLYDKLKGRNLRKGRDNLMWILLQFISGSIQKNPLADFLPVIKLYDILYLENEVLSAPDHTRASSTHDMAITCIWIHLNKKAQSDTVRLPRHIPHTLNHHLEFLKQCRNNKNLSINDYRIALLCNAYSTNSEYFGNPMAVLMESIYGNGKTTTSLPGSIVAFQPTQPLPMSMLDSLTVHAKMSLIHNIVTRVIRAASVKSSIALAPGLVETYSRLLVYMEIESLGIKGFISQLLPTVVKSQAWGILHTLLEMFSYRLHHTQPHYRVQLLSNLHSLVGVQQTNQNQLHLRIESTALRLITGLGSSEVQSQLSRVMSEPKGPTFVSQESEELNRALVLTLARAMHVTGSESYMYSSGWCHEILLAIMQHTPHSWPSHTLACFPQGLADFFQDHPVPREDNNMVKKHIETEYNKWKSMVNENDIIAHFSMQGTAPYFYCILWKILLDDKKIPNTAYKVLDRLGPRALSKHLRVFADFLVFEFSSVHGGSNVNRYIEGLNDLVWKYNVVTIDRLILCLAMRNLEGKEASVCYFVMQRVLFKPIEFRSRVNDFISENSPDHWLQNNWHEKHMIFHNSYPEKFFHDGIHDSSTPTHHQYLPVYFGNICLRFLPVLDIVIHRFLEIPQFVNTIEGLLDIIGGLYKFHDHPVTYLYNTLHYYEKKLASQALLKKKLVHSIIGALKDIRPANWCLSEDYQQYLQTQSKEITWEPKQDYYIRLVTRLVDTMAGNSPFPNCDWRFNEFPNPASHALHATCIELMALPIASQTVGENLIDVVLVSNSLLPRDKNMAWMNAIGLILTALPDSYWQVVYQRVLSILQSDVLAVPHGPNGEPYKVHQMFNFDMGHGAYAETQCGYMLALCHAVWHHASIGQLGIIPHWLKERVKGVVETEKQFVCLCYLVGPFLQRFHTERTRCLWELTVELYEILEKVDKQCEHLHYMDTISDFLYHIKYMYVGDGVKNEVEKVIRNLRPALQMRLRFISNITIEETKLGGL